RVSSAHLLQGEDAVAAIDDRALLEYDPAFSQDAGQGKPGQGWISFLRSASSPADGGDQGARRRGRAQPHPSAYPANPAVDSVELPKASYPIAWRGGQQRPKEISRGEAAGSKSMT